MPVKPLPKKLVSRLKKVSTKINKSLGRMKNIDPRQNDFARKNIFKVPSKDTYVWGGRIRQMNISRNYPGVKLVIKKMHADMRGANTELREIQLRVRNYNELIKKKGIPKDLNFVLREPIAYDLGNNLVAMAKTNKPNLNEILGDIKLKPHIIEASPTTKGRQFFRKLSKKHGFTKKQLEQAAKQVYEKIDIMPSNILLLGVKNGKFIFMPLIDLY